MRQTNETGQTCHGKWFDELHSSHATERMRPKFMVYTTFLFEYRMTEIYLFCMNTI